MLVGRAVGHSFYGRSIYSGLAAPGQLNDMQGQP